MNLKIISPAKINLGLEIGNKNSKGYHEVDMLMQSVSLFDEIEISKSQNSEISLSVDKNLNCAPEKNIAYKSAKKFFDYTNTKGCGVNIKIKKNIPICAGLAGGSADGAGVIVGLNKLFDTNLTLEQMCEIGSHVGSDIPFCIMGGTAHATGIGTQLSNPDYTIPECHIVIVKPEIEISTAKAYSDFDNLKIIKKQDLKPLISALKTQNLIKICNNLFNRFEEVIDSPEIFRIKNDLINHGALNSLMTGSGSAVYGIFDDTQKAKDCLKQVKLTYPQTFLVEPISHGAKTI